MQATGAHGIQEGLAQILREVGESRMLPREVGHPLLSGPVLSLGGCGLASLSLPLFMSASGLGAGLSRGTAAHQPHCLCLHLCSGPHLSVQPPPVWL